MDESGEDSYKEKSEEIDHTDDHEIGPEFYSESLYYEPQINKNPEEQDNQQSNHNESSEQFSA
jgi:hypothetical protein